MVQEGVGLAQRCGRNFTPIHVHPSLQTPTVCPSCDYITEALRWVSSTGSYRAWHRLAPSRTGLWVASHPCVHLQHVGCPAQEAMGLQPHRHLLGGAVWRSLVLCFLIQETGEGAALWLQTTLLRPQTILTPYDKCSTAHAYQISSCWTIKQSFYQALVLFLDG